MTNNLTPKQKAFVGEYMVDMNATQAAIRAGYSAHSAEAQASKLLRNSKVYEAIEKHKQIKAQRNEVTVDKVVRELARIGFSDLRNVMTDDGHLTNPAEWDDNTAAAISSVEVVTSSIGRVDEDGRPIVERIHKIKTWDKNAALEKLSKHLGLYVDRIEHTGANGAPLVPELSALETMRQIAFIQAQAVQEQENEIKTIETKVENKTIAKSRISTCPAKTEPTSPLCSIIRQ